MTRANSSGEGQYMETGNLHSPHGWEHVVDSSSRIQVSLLIGWGVCP